MTQTLISVRNCLPFYFIAIELTRVTCRILAHSEVQATHELYMKQEVLEESLMEDDHAQEGTIDIADASQVEG